MTPATSTLGVPWGPKSPSSAQTFLHLPAGHLLGFSWAPQAQHVPSQTHLLSPRAPSSHCAVHLGDGCRQPPAPLGGKCGGRLRFTPLLHPSQNQGLLVLSAHSSHIIPVPPAPLPWLSYCCSLCGELRQPPTWIPAFSRAPSAPVSTEQMKGSFQDSNVIT